MSNNDTNSSSKRKTVEGAIIDKVDNGITSKDLAEKDTNANARSYYLNLFSQIVNLEKDSTQIFRCQIGPCLPEDALKEVLAFNRDRTTGNIVLKNVCVEDLWVELKFPWGEGRSISYSIGETIRYAGADITYTEQGVAFVPRVSKREVDSVFKKIDFGKSVDVLVGDSILIGNKTLAILQDNQDKINSTDADDIFNGDWS